jgi:GTP-binding protein Era
MPLEPEDTLSLPPDFRCGYISLAGKPNVGKSTLMNALVGQRLSIVTPKAQTTRERVVGILTHADYQAVFLDAPGLIDAEYPLQEAMTLSARTAIEEADVLIYVTDATRRKTLPDHALIESLMNRELPTLNVLNKCDAVGQDVVNELGESLKRLGVESLAVSALTGMGLDMLLSWVVPNLPLSPPLFPVDDSAAQSVRFFAQEFVRETCMDALREELPYSVICRVDEFRESQDPAYVGVTIYVERESQKGIVIGKGGATIRRIGKVSREKIESLIDQRVYLDLRVKVMPNWSRKRSRLRQLGFQLPPER